MAPPRPRCCINVGVTGHRLDRVGRAQLDEATPALNALLHTVARLGTALCANAGDVFSEATPGLRLLSGLAEGSDRHVAAVAAASGFALNAVLPFERASYAADFESEPSLADFLSLLARAERVFEMPGDRAEPERAYEMTGLGILAHSDLLIAIWDGTEARGAGGTAEVIRIALKRGIPVVRFDPDRWHAPTLVWSRLSRVPAEHENIADYPSRAADEPAIAHVLDRLLLPVGDSSERGFLAEYFAETERLTRMRLEYSLMLALTGVKRLTAGAFRVPAYAASTAREWNGVRVALGEIGGTHVAASDELREAYAWADNLANHFAQVYRSGHVTNFFLAALAVLLACAGLVWPAGKLWLIIGELGVIMLLVVHTHIGRARQWHRRWLDYRYIAERLRPMRTLKLFGLARAGRASLRTEANIARWTDWYADAMWRQMGCPTGRVDAAYRKGLEALVMSEEIRPQIRYHEAAAGHMEHLEHRLHRIGNALFIATIGAGTLFLIGYFASHEWTVTHAAVFTAVTAALPALGGAIYGIRVQGDFGGTARRSLQTANELRLVADSLTADSPRFTQAADMAEMAARVMLTDLAEWQLTYRQRNLEVPG